MESYSIEVRNSKIFLTIVEDNSINTIEFNTRYDISSSGNFIKIKDSNKTAGFNYLLLEDKLGTNTPKEYIDVLNDVVNKSEIQETQNLINNDEDEVIEYPTSTNQIIVNTIEDFTQACLNAPSGSEIILEEGFNIDTSDLTRRFDINNSVIIRSENPSNRSSINLGGNGSSLTVNASNCYIIDLVIIGSLTGQDVNLPTTSAIRVINVNNFECFNCEIFGFTSAAISLNNSLNAKIHHNYIHECQRSGLGYGTVLIGKTTAEIYNNEYYLNRHDISGTGEKGQSYKAYNNIVYKAAYPNIHSFDMHSRLDNGQYLSGEFVEIYNNIFYSNSFPAIVVRGIPRQYARIYNNDFVRTNVNTAVRQTDGTPSNTPFIISNWKNMEVYDNNYLASLDDNITSNSIIYFQNNKGILKYNLFSKTANVISTNTFNVQLLNGNFLNTDDLIIQNRKSISLYSLDKFYNFELNSTFDIVGIKKGRTQQNTIDELIYWDSNGDVYSVEFTGNSKTETLLINNSNIKDIVSGQFFDTTPNHDLILLDNNNDMFLYQNNGSGFNAPTDLNNSIPFRKLYTTSFFTNGFNDIFGIHETSGVYRIRILSGAIRSGDPFLSVTTTTGNLNYFTKDLNGTNRLFVYNESGVLKLYTASGSGFTSVSVADLAYIGKIKNIN